ncbi:MAG: hypothetical protein ACREXS_12120, partial [Gammaproteobacteria bacterium]
PRPNAMLRLMMMPTSEAAANTLPADYTPDYTDKLDGRTRLGRQIRDKYSALVQDLGGEDHLSHQQRSLCRRSVWLELMLEHEESRIAAGEGINIAPHTQLVNSLLHVYRALGLKRQARDITLHDVLRRTKGKL